MLVQRRDDGLRLVRQHDHALLAGRVAAAWILPPAAPVPWSTVLAVSLHDVVWSREDRRPRLSPRTGLPWDFASLPSARKAVLVEEGLARLRAVSPELARPVAAHHRALAQGPPPEPDPELTRLRFFDVLSLRLCLTPPSAVAPPSWLTSPEEVGPGGYPPPLLRWHGPDEARLDPFPFREPLELCLPVRDLPAGPYPDQASLDRAWEEAGERIWRLRLVAP